MLWSSSPVFKQAPQLLLHMSWNPLPGAGIDSIVKHLSFAPQQQYSSMETSLHHSHSTTWVFQLFLYFGFTVLLTSCLSPFSFLCHLYTTQNTWFTFENNSQTKDKLKPITPTHIDVTSSLAVEFITSLQTSTTVGVADMSWNPLPGAGIDSIVKHLS